MVTNASNIIFLINGQTTLKVLKKSLYAAYQYAEYVRGEQQLRQVTEQGLTKGKED